MIGQIVDRSVCPPRFQVEPNFSRRLETNLTNIYSIVTLSGRLRHPPRWKIFPILKSRDVASEFF